jgi:hypothetical protein
MSWVISGSSPDRGWEFFSSPQHPDWLLGLPSLFNGYEGLFSLEVKQPGHEADHTPPSSTEVKNAWSCTSTPNTPSWHGAQLKPRDNFTFTFTLFSYMFS